MRAILATLIVCLFACVLAVGAEARPRHQNPMVVGLGRGLAHMLASAQRAQTVRASWYHEGTHTANGERFNPDGRTAASLTIPIGRRIRVCYRGCVDVLINDHGPYVKGVALDLSRGAARAIGMIEVGVANVRVYR